MSSTMVINW